MEHKEYKFEIVTPLIMSGTDKNNLELRTQSIKGILRWWYRFINGGIKDLNQLKIDEADIFGSQEKASKIKLKINDIPEQTTQAYLCMNDNRSINDNSNKVKKHYNKICKNAYDVDNSFTLAVLFENKNIIEEFENILFFINYFGGLGSRWRRGFGSVKINNSNNQNLFEYNFKSFEELSEYLKNKINLLNHNNNLSFTNLSNSDLFVIKPENKNWQSWENAMNDLRGNFYREFKNRIQKRSIGNFNPRQPSPLIIQIKKAKISNEIKYYGIIISSYNNKDSNNKLKNDFYTKSEFIDFINSLKTYNLISDIK